MTRVIRLGGLYDKPNGRKHEAGAIYDPNGLAPTLNTCNGGNRMPLIIVYEPKIKENNRNTPN